MRSPALRTHWTHCRRRALISSPELPMSTVYLIFVVGVLMICPYCHDAQIVMDIFSRLTAPTVTCERSQFECSDGSECIWMNLRCNGKDDCPDRSDEAECGTRLCPSPGEEHRCGNGKCLAKWLVCDGKRDCKDGSDEKGCVPSPFCLKNEFKCSDESGMCVPITYRCDSSNSDCLDKSDEQDCSASTCPAGELLCDDGRCVPESSVCDGSWNCYDRSDDDDCDFKDVEPIFFNEGPGVFMKVRNKGGHESTRLLPVQFGSESIITGLSFNEKRQTLYISDAGTPAIYGVKVQALLEWEMVNDYLSYPLDVAFDWRNENLYWIDYDKGTAEVASVKTLNRSVIVDGLVNPISLAISPMSGMMAIASMVMGTEESDSSVIETGLERSVSMYGMDGRHKRILPWVKGSPLSLALHPFKSLLYWNDPAARTIFYANYTASRSAIKANKTVRILKSGISGLMSVAASERTVLYTFDELSASEGVHWANLPGYEKDGRWKSITGGVKQSGRWRSRPLPDGAFSISGKSDCSLNNRGCAHLCLSSLEEGGTSCACPPGQTLDADGESCSDEN